MRDGVQKFIFLLSILFLGERVNALVRYDSMISQEDSVVALREVEIIHNKENAPLTKQPVSSSVVKAEDLERMHLASLKQVSEQVANVFIPDYGSRLTSAVYIRGIGSRINSPAVGLYVDNVPYIDKSAFDFKFYDIERVEILRGPQGTLYGRNTMGGLVRITTKNPFRYQGTDISIGYATQDSHRDLAVTHYHRINNQLAFSAGGYYEGGDGFFHNDITDRPADALQAGGGRMRLLYFPSDNLKLDFNLTYDYSDEGAYPYIYNDSISANHMGNYRRGMLNGGVNVEYKMKNMTLTSCTGLQHLNDRMFMDQDFTKQNIFTLEQKQNTNVFSEEITLRSNPYDLHNEKRYSWLLGISTFYQNLTTNGPVSFYDEGVKTMIEDNVNDIFQNIKQTNPAMPNMMLDVTDEQFVVQSDMKTPVWSGALFHQSSLSWGDLNLTAGLRLEYEKMSLDYHSGTSLDYTFQIPQYHYSTPLLTSTPQLLGTLKKDYIQLLPKAAISYTPSLLSNKSTLCTYFCVSKGYRSGGYNIQMFSDLIRGELKNDMITQINQASSGMMSRFVNVDSLKSVIDSGSVEYKPEYAWNYEIGAKYHSKNFSAEMALFVIDTYNQQISRFAKTGLGRMMVNAGRSRSYGAELSLTSLSSLTSPSSLVFRLNYGYTHATFREYDDGEHNYKNNFVPFVPMHTLSLMTDYNINTTWAVGVAVAGAGRVYWTEANNLWQDFYATLSAHVVARINDMMCITLWGKNLTQTQYDTFCFESMNKCFTQRCHPLQIGIDLKLHL